MRNKKLINDITLDGLFIAILFVMTFVPSLGFLTLGPISITFIHVPVILGATLLGWKRGLIYGMAFGLASWFNALRAISVLDVYFADPLVSVLPRVIFGLIVGSAAHLFLKPQNGRKKNSLRVIPIAGVVTTLHTVLVIGTLVLLNPNLLELGWPFFAAILLNMCVEVGVAIFLIYLLYRGLFNLFEVRRLKYNEEAINEGVEDEF